MRAPPAEYLSLRLRAHELLHDVPLYDVSVVDLPGGGAGRSVADIRALDSAVAPSRVEKCVLRPAPFPRTRLQLGPRADSARRLAAVAAVGARPPRLRNHPRHSRWLGPFAVFVF